MLRPACGSPTRRPAKPSLPRQAALPMWAKCWAGRRRSRTPMRQKKRRRDRRRWGSRRRRERPNMPRWKRRGKGWDKASGTRYAGGGRGEGRLQQLLSLEWSPKKKKKWEEKSVVIVGQFWEAASEARTLFLFAVIFIWDEWSIGRRRAAGAVPVSQQRRVGQGEDNGRHAATSVLHSCSAQAVTCERGVRRTRRLSGLACCLLLPSAASTAAVGATLQRRWKTGWLRAGRGWGELRAPAPPPPNLNYSRPKWRFPRPRLGPFAWERIEPEKFPNIPLTVEWFNGHREIYILCSTNQEMINQSIKHVG